MLHCGVILKHRHSAIPELPSNVITDFPCEILSEKLLRRGKYNVNLSKTLLHVSHEKVCHGKSNGKWRKDIYSSRGPGMGLAAVSVHDNVRVLVHQGDWGAVARSAQRMPTLVRRDCSELSNNGCARKIVDEALKMSGFQDTSGLVTLVLEMIVTVDDFLPSVLSSIVQRRNLSCPVPPKAEAEVSAKPSEKDKCQRRQLGKCGATVREQRWQRLLACVGQSNLQHEERVRVILGVLAIMLHSKEVTLNAQHIGTAVSVCVKSGSMAAAEKIVTTAKLVGGASMPNARVFTLLIHGHCNLGHRKAAFSVLQDMEDSSVHPDRVVFNILLEGEQQPDGVKKILEKLRMAGIMPCERTYSAAIRSLGRAGRWEDAEALWQDMIASRVTPSLFTYNSLMDAFANAGKTRLCRSLLVEMERAGVGVDHVTYATLIKACARDKDGEGALFILRHMEQSGIEVRVDAYNVAMDACVRGGQMEAALDLADEAQNLHAIILDSVSYATLLRAAGHLRDVEKVRALLAQMASHGVEHDAVTYRCAVHAFVRCGDGGSALSLLEAMTAAGHPPAMDVADVLIKSVDAALLRECTRVAPAGNLRRFLADMALAGLTPTAATGGGLVRKLANSQGCTIALRVAEELLHAHVGPLGLHAWQVVAAAIARHPGFQEAAAAARHLRTVMLMDGTLPDSHICEVGISACTRGGDGEGALMWHEALQETKGNSHAYPVQRIFLDTLDAALTAALAADMGKAAAPRPSGADADADAEDATSPPSSHSRFEPRIIEDLAATGVRLKTRGVSKLVKQLFATSEAPATVTPTTPTTTTQPRRPQAVKAAESAAACAPKQTLHLNPQQQWLHKALVMVDALPRLLQVQPSTFVYLSLMDTCRRQGQSERVELMWERMREAGVKPNAVTWASRIHALSQSHAFAPQLFRTLLPEIVNDGLHLNSIVLRALLKACRGVNDKDGVDYMLRMLEASQRVQTNSSTNSSYSSSSSSSSSPSSSTTTTTNTTYSTTTTTH